MDTPGHRSLADQLRSWPPERVARLLLARPDLATPAPHDSGQLASRAATRSSLLRALDELNTCELHVLDALVATGQTTLEQLRDLVNADTAAVDEALATLEDRALAWRSVGGLRALTGVAELLAASPATSGVRAFSAEPLSPEQVAQRLSALSPPARAMLEHVDAHGGEATSGSARLTVTAEQAATPAEELIAHRLLVPRGSLLVLPGEVAVVLRGGRTTRERVDLPPELPSSERSQASVDRVAAGAAAELVRHVELLLDTWSAAPPAVLRSGGLAVRDLRATATALRLDEPTTALHLEVAAAAGLLATAADEDGTPRWVPTDRYDEWAQEGLARRWTALARAWLDMPRLPALVGTKDPTGKTWNALVPELSAPTVAESRRMTLEALAGLPAGRVLATGTGGAAVLARVGWERPRRPRSRAEQVGWALAEAPVVGLTGLGGLATYARPLLAEEDPAPALEPLLPAPVDHVLLQADLTAVAPGPLESSLARRLQAMAELESHGGAAVYRFTPASVRRAMDLGWTSAQVHEFLAAVSRTPVPQPLTYLVDDTARTFGTVRVGYAGAYLRAEEPHALDELLAHPAAESLGLRRLAPTVVVSPTSLDVLLPKLREIGAAPAVEDAEGVVHVARPEARRARTPQQSRVPTGARSAHDTARATAVAARISAADRSAPPRDAVTRTPADSLAVLREAADEQAPVVLGFVDGHGVAGEVTVVPLGIDAGRLTARVGPHDDDVRLFPLSRVRTVRRA